MQYHLTNLVNPFMLCKIMYLFKVLDTHPLLLKYYSVYTFFADVLPSASVIIVDIMAVLD